ncbi:MAG: T9SS type A sorting domain-containing protein [Chitinophagaceae bacterium]|nr:T9SS type A sorting domain-containing protein [Chitinophagaceae bacterium]
MNSIKKAGSPLRAPAQLVCLSFLFFSFVFYAPAVSAQYQKTQKAVSVKINSSVNGYYESLPVDYASNPSKKYPLLIFIHGKGELGNGTSQLSLVLKNGPPKLLNEGKFPSSFTVGGKSFSFIVISPQLVSNDYTNSPEIINDVINYCKQKYRIDEQRVYLTGLSMGGTMTWYYAGKSKEYANTLAAGLTVCGSISNTTSRVNNIAGTQLPVWATINSGDPIISVPANTAAINALNAFVPTPPKSLISIFSANGHDAWTKTYDPNFKQGGLNVYEWMLTYSRGSSTPTTGVQQSSVGLKANAGSNQTITLPASSVILDGSVSSVYPSGSTIKWTKVNGPAGGNIVSPGYIKTSINGLNAEGDYQFQLMITDPSGKVSTSSTHVIVNADPTSSSSPLKANAGANQTITLPTNSVTVDGGTKSTYPTGSSFMWRRVLGPESGKIVSPSSLKTAITGLNIVGDYQFQLVITDPSGKVSTSSMHVIVNADPTSSSSPLKANAGGNQTITLPTSSVILDGSVNSVYPSGSAIKWTKVNGPAGGNIVSPGYIRTTINGLNTEGDYQFQLMITDPSGNVSTSFVHVIVNVSPSYRSSVLKANAGGNQTITLPTNSVTVDGGTKSSYPTGSSFMWRRVLGPESGNIVSSSSLKTAITGLNIVGDYQFQLVITDPSGNVSTSSMHVIVNANPASSLKANAGENQTITLPTSSVILDGSINSIYPSGSTIKWTKVNGPAGGNVVSPGYIRTTINGLNTEGDYQFQLMITDPNGNVSTSSTHIIVNADPASSLKANAGGNQTITLPASSVIVDGSVKSVYPSGSTILWRKVKGPDAGNIVSPGYIRSTINGLKTEGDYQFQLVITDRDGNVSTSSMHVIVQAAGTKPSARTASLPGDANDEPSSVQASATNAISSGSRDMELKVFPNPVRSDMQLLLDGQTTGRVSVILYNTQGQPVLRQDFVKDNSGSVNKSINLSKLPTGIYVLQAIVEDGHKQTIRIVKQ